MTELENVNIPPSMGTPPTMGRHPGLFFIFGSGTPRNLAALQSLARLDGCRALTLPLGPDRQIFVYTTYRDIAESDDAWVINLGVSRDKETGEVLTAQDLLRQGIATPERIAVERLSGNLLLVCISKRGAKACFFRSVVGTIGLYYHRSGDDFFCSDRQRLLLPLLPNLELSDQAVVSHFMFRSVHGDVGYFKHIKHLEHGHLATWTDSAFSTHLAQDLSAFYPPSVDHLDDGVVDKFSQQAGQILSAYITWLDRLGYLYANTLSGGIDSAFLQYLINQNLTEAIRPRTLSYAISTPQFKMEIDYARSASALLGTEHEFVELDAQHYPDLLRQAIDIVAQPIGHESMPGQLAVAKYLHTKHSPFVYIFSGVASDTLHGTESSKRLLQLDRSRSIPFGAEILRGLAAFLRLFAPNKAYGARELAALLKAIRDADSPDHPLNAHGLFTDLGLVVKCFGPQAVQTAFDYKRHVASAYSDLPTLVEKVHALQLTALVADEQPLIAQLYNAHHLQVLSPYLDYGYIQLSMALDPHVRFYNQGRTKPVLKRALEMHTRYDQVDKQKGHSGFDRDLRVWMKTGVLRDLVQSIDRPSFMTQADFEQVLNRPDWFTWNLLTFDIFQKQVLRPARQQ